MSDLDKIIAYLAASPWMTIIDASYWQVEFGIDITKYPEILKILDVVILRTGHGGWKDTKFEAFYAVLEEYPNIVRGVYHYFTYDTAWETQVGIMLAATDGKYFDWYWNDAEARPPTLALEASYSITGVRFMKRIQRERPGKRVSVYSRKDRYEMLRKYSAEWDDFSYVHAQYPYYHWYEITPKFLDYVRKLIVTIGGKFEINLPSTRRPDKWAARQIVDKSGLGNYLGFKSKNIDIGISRLVRAAFLFWIGPLERPGGPPPPPPPPTVGNALIIEGLPTGDYANATIRAY